MNNSQLPSSVSAFSKPNLDLAALFDSILELANAHYAREDYLAARDFLVLAARVNPGHPRLLGSLGSLQFQLEDYPGACRSFIAALRQTPDDADLHIQLAMAHLQLKEIGEAAAALLQSVSLRSFNPIARQMLGDIAFAAKQYAEAAEYYRVVLENKPNDVILLLHLGKCYFELSNRVSALWCYERVIALEPANEIASEALSILRAAAKAA